ncbi:MAG: BamA/TamA family outer membrane protein [Myxococcota bacterium]|nr:BamA/TamA family outer membrane protein [Myxococcota bacterium]
MRSCPTRWIPLLALLLGFGGGGAAGAQQILKEVGEPVVKRDVLLPYLFWTDSTKLLAGGVYATTIQDQPWTSAFVTAFASTNGTVPVYAGAFDIQIAPRLFVDPRFHVGRWDQVRAYNVVAPFVEPRPGSHDSDKDLFIDDAAIDWWLELPFHYVLPLGSAREDPVATYELDRGLLASGPAAATTWNPLTHGRTQVGLELFVRQQRFDVLGDASSFETLGAELSIDHDNRDFPSNPSRGSRQQVRIAYDPGWFASEGAWWTWEVELSKYFDLGATERFRQRVLALNLWTVDTPSFDEDRLPDGLVAQSNRPPQFRGATLGGFYRMRAYPNARFNDQAAVYYSAELRLIPHWNPLPRIDFVVEAEVDWWQLVLFVEAGRVADTWSPSALHSDLNWDGGIGIRAMIAKAVFRAGVAGSDEGFGIRAMVSHPF